LSSAKRIRMVLATAVFMVAMVLVMVIPASAALTHYFFIPAGELAPGIPAFTVTCEDTDDPINVVTCHVIDVGNVVPADLICDVPVTFEFEGEPVFDGFQCRTVEEAVAEPLPPAPITQEGEQDSDAGEIDQSYDVS
jgi:hypothetical protein